MFVCMHFCMYAFAFVVVPGCDVPRSSRCLAWRTYAKQFHMIEQIRTRRNPGRRASRPVGVPRGDKNFRHLSHAHRFDRRIEAGQDALGPDGERKGQLSVTRIFNFYIRTGIRRRQVQFIMNLNVCQSMLMLEMKNCASMYGMVLQYAYTHDAHVILLWIANAVASTNGPNQNSVARRAGSGQRHRRRHV